MEWAVLGQVLAGVGSLGAGAGWSLGLCHKDSHPPDNIMEWAVLGQVLTGVGSLEAGAGWSLGLCHKDSDLSGQP